MSTSLEQARTRPPSSGKPVALFAVVGAFAAGIVGAKILDWMGHGHPHA